MADDFDSLLHSFDSLDGIGSVNVRSSSGADLQDASQIPEIERLEAFIKELEDEIALSKAPSLDHHLNPIMEADDESDHDDEFLNMPADAAVEFATKHRVNVDGFLEAVKVSSGAKKHPSPSSHPPTPLSPTSPRRSGSFTNDSFDGFYSSAQDEAVHTPRISGHPSATPPRPLSFNQAKPRSFRMVEDFTMASLRRNWDMEEEVAGQMDSISRVVNAKNIHDQEHLTQKLDATRNSTPEAEEPLAVVQEIIPPFSPPRPASPDEGSFTIIRRKSEVEQVRDMVKSPARSANIGKDERLKGDFMICSAGEKLSNAYIFGEYIGLHPTTVSHHNDHGKLVPAPIPQKEYLSADMNQRSALGKLAAIDPTSYMNKQPVNSTAASNATKGYYNIHVMECIIRPDIELKAVMAVIVQLGKLYQCKCTLLQRSHAVLTPTYGTNPSKTSAILSRLSIDHGVVNSSPGEYSLEHKEFDCVDVQICISRSVRQRVILLQFMKRMTVYNGLGIGNILINQLSGPLEYLSLKQCPDTKKFLGKLRKDLITAEMCFSSLYHCSLVNVCSLPQGLDAHFLAQLNSLCRDVMWQKLDAEYKMMEEHVKLQDQMTNDFIKAVEPMYKHFNTPLPPMQRVGSNTLLPYVPSGENLASLTEDTAPPPPKDDGAGIAGIMQSPARLTPSKITDSSLLKNGKVDGMTFCLVLLDRCYQDMLTSCDEEYGTRVQRKNMSTVVAIQERAMYKRLLLTNLFNHPASKSSPFQHAFVQLFQHVPVATAHSTPYDMGPVPATQTAPAASKGWFGWNKAQQHEGMELTDTATQAASAALTGGMFASIFFKSNSPTAAAPPRAPVPSVLSIPSDDEYEDVKNDASDKVLPDKLPRSILLYYCACLVGVINNPSPSSTMSTNSMLSGTCYISSHYICVVTSSNMLVGVMNNSIQLLNNNMTNMVSSLTQKSKEVYRFADLRDITLIPPTNNRSSSTDSGDGKDHNETLSSRMFTNNGMVKLTFFGGARDVYISPLVQEASKVKLIIDEVRDEFAGVL